MNQYITKREKDIRDSICAALENPNNNIHLFKKDIDKDGGKLVKFLNRKIGILVGISDGYGDYYFVVYTTDDKIMSVSGACKYEMLTDDEIADSQEARSLIEKQKKLTSFHLYDLFEKYCKEDLLVYGFYF